MAAVEIELSNPQAKILQAQAARNLFLAGVGSGKSHIIALLAADIIKNNPDLIQFIGANTYGQLSKSTLKRVFDVWHQVFKWKQGLDFVVDRKPPKHFTQIHEQLKSYENTICFSNGAMLFTASLDNYKVIDGTEFAIAYLDETKDTKEDAVKEVIIARLRQPGLMIAGNGTVYSQQQAKARLTAGVWLQVEVDGEPVILDENQQKVRGWNPLYIFTSPAKVAWLNDWFNLTSNAEKIAAKIFSKTDYYYAEDENTAVVISSTYHNAHNLAPGYISTMLKNLAGNPEKVNMLIYGSPIAKTGGEFVPMFKRLEHVKPLTFDSELPAHLTFDFNVAPYMSALVAQLATGADGRLKLRIVKEYALASPRNTSIDVASAFTVDYGAICKGLFYYGDPSGRNRQTVSKEFTDNYDAISKILYRWKHNTWDRVQNSHPAVLKSRDFLNALFVGTHGIDIEIDPGCHKLIADLEYCKEDANGKLLKETIKDPDTKQSYQKNGHLLDAFRYLCVALFVKLYDKL